MLTFGLQSTNGPKGDSILAWANKSGEFKRPDSIFRNFISKEPGAEFPPEKDRYHLYVSYACPWGKPVSLLLSQLSLAQWLFLAHRVLIVRKLKGLENIIPYTSVHWEMLEKGWRFATKDENIPGENVTPDPLHPDYTHLRNIYFGVNPDYTGRFTVPTLYDKKQNKIVSNESSEVIRMLYSVFDDLLPEKYQSVDLLPEDLRKDIEETNSWTYHDINNGVYKSGFATNEEAYASACRTLFKSLDRAEAHLASSPGPFYYGARLTEADVRLYTTIIRFDPVYVQHFKCNLKDIRSGYPHLHKWVRHLYWDVPAFGETTQFEHIKKHYTKSHKQLNQQSITPLGPEKDILRKDEEVPAVEAALHAAGK